MSPEDTPIIAARLCEFESRVKSELDLRGGFAGLTMVTSGALAPSDCDWAVTFHCFAIKTPAGETRPADIKGRGPCPLSAIEAAFKTLAERAQAREVA